MSTSEAKVPIAGAILCLLGLILLAYGISNMSYTSAVSNTYIIIIGIFTGMAGMFMLLMFLLQARALER